ncbi:1-aminocyclopropane-1-carboxylate synthase 1 [Fusarium sporotrichioides]|uniref:1-aminocyclopropane-1-carboxylate synthase 1 n=1 Tax=Fusarium sporotrichioides TaxID=5514 RepID=A0A395SN87_FUSSP|nr:1-aminocyclopropane-1-carboxylate synthase 1 [Fusarium sporotrichioides]
MTLLQRSCQACVKARRRCNLATPCCERCSTKRIKCCYINEPAPVAAGSHHTSMIKPAQDYKRLTGLLNGLNSSSLVLSGELDTGLQMRIRQVLRDGYYQGSRPPLTPLRVHESNIVSKTKSTGVRIFNPLHLEVVRVFDSGTLHQLSDILQGFPAEFADDNKTAFIHSGIYSPCLPPQLQHVRDICFSYQIGGEYLATHRLDALRSTIRRLLRSATRTSSFGDTLAHAQAITLAQIVRLLVCKDTSEDQVERDNEDMWALTHQLWQHAPIQLPSTLSPWQAWLFSESVRRTIMVCNILLAVYSSLKRGYTMHSLCVEALPFDVRTHLWDAGTEEDWEVGASRTTSPSLITLSQFTTSEQVVSRGSGFEDVLVQAFGS